MESVAGAAARCVPLGELSDEDLRRWHELSGRAVEPNPFIEPAFLLPAWRHLDGGRDVSALIVEDGDRWLAFTPVRFTRIGGLLRSLSTWRHEYCFLDTPLLDAEAVESAARELIEAAAATARGAVVTFERLGDDGPVAAAIRRAAEGRSLEPALERSFERATLHRRGTPTYLEGIRAHHRRDQERLWRRLQREVGQDLAVVDHAGDPEAVERFLAIELATWKGREGTAIASRRADADFFRAMCADFAAEGRLQLLDLGADGDTVAMKCNIVSGGAAFCFKIAHDERFDRCSPGVQLERAHVDVFHGERDEQWLDSCASPDNEMINRLWPDRRRITTMVFARSGSRSAVVGYGLRRAQGLRRLQGAA